MSHAHIFGQCRSRKNRRRRTLAFISFQVLLWGSVLGFQGADNRIASVGGGVPGVQPAADETPAISTAPTPPANAWKSSPPVSVSAVSVSAHAMAYDSESARTVLFGGLAAADLTNDTWAHDSVTNSWTNMDPGARPPARSLHAMVYDSGSDRVILFGGLGAAGLVNDTWAYDFNTNTWANLVPSARPPARMRPAMAYHSGYDRVILFGGLDDSFGPLNDT